MVVADAHHEFDQAFPGTVDFAYGAVAWVVNNGNYQHVEPQPVLKSISFCTGRSQMTRGRRWTVQVVSGLDGQTHVTVTITQRNRFQRLDAVRTAKLANEFHRKIARAVVAVVPRGSPEL